MNDYSEPKVTGQPEAGSRQRPGCITIYAILLALGGVANIVISALLGYGFVVDPDFVTVGIILLLCLFAWSLVPIIMAVGLWRMRMWAWWLVVISQIFGLAMACLSLVLVVPVIVTGFAGRVGTAELISLVVGVPLGFLISGIILYWFLTNRHRFRQRGLVHVGGRALEEPTSNNVVIVAVTVIGVLAIFCVVGVAVIALLTLMGPQIGTTFSEITRSLMTPVP